MKNLKGFFLGVGVAAAMLTACTSADKQMTTLSGLNPAAFDSTIDGKKTALFILKNQNGMEVCITNYGGRVVSLVVPDKEGKPTDVVLGLAAMLTASTTEKSSSMATPFNCVRTTQATVPSTVCTVVATQVG